MLMIIAKWNTPKAVQGLLDGGTNVKTKNNKGRKALDLTRRNNKLKKLR